MMLSALARTMRLLGRQKLHAAISLFGVTLTLLVLVVASAVGDAVLGSGGEQQDAHRTLVLGWVRVQSADGSSSGNVGWELVQRCLRDLPGAEEVAVFAEGEDADAWVGDEEIGLDLKATDGAYWRVHRFRFLEGAPFTDDDVEQERRVIVLARSAAREAFGDGPFTGREISLHGVPFRVVGVVEDPSVLRSLAHATAWMPLTHVRGVRTTRLHGRLTGIVLARRAGDLPRLRREIASRVAAIEVEPGQELQAHADTIEDDVARGALPPRADGRAPTGGLRARLVLLAIAFLALPVLNLVNLSLGRVLERATEIGVRKAFGATPASLVARLVAENVVLVLGGAVLALALAPFVLHAVDASGLLPGSRLGVNLRVIGWGVAWAIVFGVVSGAWPAWRMARWHPVEALRGRISW